MSFTPNIKYNETVKAALKATVHDKCDYLVYIDHNEVYGFIHGERGRILVLGDDVTLLGWTEFAVNYNISTASYFEFECPQKLRDLNIR